MEEVASVDVGHYYVESVFCFKNINKTHNIGMFAHFQNINFSSDLNSVFFERKEIFFGHDFDRYFFLSEFVDGFFYYSVFAFADLAEEGVFWVNGLEIEGKLYVFHPQISLLRAVQIVNATFVREAQHKGVQSLITDFFLFLRFDENPGQTRQICKFAVLVRVQLLSLEDEPVCLQVTFLLFLDDKPLKLNSVLPFTVLAEGWRFQSYLAAETIGAGTLARA